jgi:hypothetical protein
MSNPEPLPPSAVYAGIATEMENALADVPAGALAGRFHHVMTRGLQYMVAQKDAVRRMVMNNLSGEIDDMESYALNFGKVTEVFKTVVGGSVDTLSAAQVEQMTVLLTNVHLLFMMFLLHDRTEGNKASFDLLAFARDAFTLLCPVLMIPPGAKALARLSQILVSAMAW